MKSIKNKKLPQNLIDLGYYYCRKHGLRNERPCPTCVTEAERTKEGKCNATIWHGPGHQSKTYCQKRGSHKIHFAVYGCYEQEANWKGNKRYTGYFDEPPSLNRRVKK